MATECAEITRYCTLQGTDSTVKKYAGYMTALMLAVKHLEKLQALRKFGYNDTVRLYIPSKVVYNWFKTKSPNNYVGEFETLYTRMVNLMPTIEFVCSVDGQKINKAIPLCEKGNVLHNENYTFIKEEMYI